MGSATSKICFTNNNKVKYYTTTGMDSLSYSGTYKIFHKKILIFSWQEKIKSIY